MATYTIVTPLPNNSSLFDVFPPKSGSGSGLSTYSITNTDGTVTTFTGVNLTWNGNTATAGEVTSIVRTSADGTVTYDQITGFTHGFNDSFQAIWNPGPTAQAARAGFIFGGVDTFNGGNGNDFFRGYNGADTFNGGSGNDQVGYDNDGIAPPGGGTGAIIVNLSATTQMGVAPNRARDGFGTIDTLNSIEEARGGAQADFFFGSTSYNLFSGRGGADTYDGGNTVAFFKGFAGTLWNWADYRQDGGSAGINITLTNGTATPGVDGAGNTAGSGIDTFGATETFTNINAIRGSNNAGLTDTVHGNDFFNYFEGLAGVDIFDGSGGSDRYAYNNEARFGGSTTRGVKVNLSDTTVTLNGISVAAHTGIDTFGPTGSVDQLINVEEINGTNQADFVQGNQFDNKFFLFDGNDHATLGRGFDYVEPGAGNDTIDGSAGAGLDQSYEDRDEVSYDDFGGNGVGVYIDLNAQTFVDPTGGVDTVIDIERLRGTSSADTLIGSDFANQREEMYRGLAGNDIIDGRNGYDVADYSQDANFGGTAGIIANLSGAATTVHGITVQGGTIRDGFGATDSVFYVEGIRGTAGDDTMVGDAGNNTFRPMGGTDTIDGGTGIDQIEMYFGDVFTGLGSIVNLGATDFTFAGHTVATNTAFQFDGHTVTFSSIEVVTGSFTDDAINGSDARETINGFLGNDTILGNGGDDVIAGHQGANTLDGGDGFDVVSFMYDKTMGDYFATNYPGNGFVTWGGVTVNLGNHSAMGFDGLVSSITNFEAVTGTFVDDNITGDGNDNTFRGLSGNDTMDGAGGNDTVNYSPTNQDGRVLVPIEGVNYSEPDVVRVNLTASTLNLGGVSIGAGTADDGDGGTDTLSSIENVTGSIGDDFIAANGVANVIDGWSGNDTVVYAGVESDYTITAGNGGWQVQRIGAPSDTDFLSNVETLEFAGGGTKALPAQGLTETGGTQADEITGVQGDDNLDGGGGSDFVDGGEGSDNIEGGSGSDELVGGDGDDVVDGGDDDDTIVAGHGGGNDTYIGGTGIDTATYTSTTLGIVLDLDVPGNPGGAAGTASGSEIGTDQLTGIENVTGGQGADSITGDDIANELQGAAGADQLLGEGGEDILRGGSGNDILHGDAANDLLYGDSDDDILKGGAGDDLLDGGANSLVGGDTADFSDATGSVVATLGTDGDAVVAAAGIGRDTLIRIENITGGNFNDTLAGNASANVLTSGGGDDRFVYGPGGGADIFADFVAGAGTEDKIDLTAFADIQTLDDVLALANQVGSDTRIDFGNGDVITLLNVAKTSLTADDLILLSIPTPLIGPIDFNGDGMNDMLFRNSSGRIATWEMNGSQIIGSADYGAVNSSWNVVGAGDFNGDGASDILWRNSDGRTVTWEIDGHQIIGAPDFGIVSNEWTTAGTGDFNRDGISDILWRKDNGRIATWEMNGSEITGSADYGAVNSYWKIEGTDDFNSDGASDILWRNSTNGQVTLWLLDGNQITTAPDLGMATNSWRVAGTGDFNDDGMNDILWRNDNGRVALWLVDGDQIIATPDLGVANLTWAIEDVGDYNGDGTSDILWRNDNGQVVTWEFDNGQIVNAPVLGTVSPAWEIIG